MAGLTAVVVDVNKLDKIDDEAVLGLDGISNSLGLTAGTYTELVLDMTDKAGGTIVSVQTGRAPVGSKLWARCLSYGFDTGTLDFYMGIHEYQG